jgi:integrase
MPRQKKPTLKKRKDNRYKCKYHGKQFYGSSPEEAFARMEEYKRNEKAGLVRQPSVSDYALPWLKRTFPTVADTTYTGLAIHLQHLIDEIGGKRISSVVPSDIKSVYTNQYKNCSNSYLKAARQLFSSLFDAAVADGLCRSNPARDRTAKPHKGNVGKHRPITDQERSWIETFCHDHRAYPAVITMLYSGIRPQEAKALTIETALDEKAGVLHITETAHRSGNNQYEISKTMKTEKSKRDVPLMPPVLEALKGREGLLITTAKGKQITSTTWRNAFDSYKTCMETAINGVSRRWYGKTKEHKAILDAGGKLPPFVEFTPVPYDYRVSFCTWGRDHGVELHTMIEWMGHADAKMIMKIYDEVSDSRSKTQAEMLKKTAFGVQNGVQTEKEKPVTFEITGVDDN